jgi:hypothetical protein
MTHHAAHWLTSVGVIVFVLAGCAILALTTLTFAAIWVGRGDGPPGSRRPMGPRPPL